MVNHPGDYRWSSYACNAQGIVQDLIVPHPIYQSLGESLHQRYHTYRELFRTDIAPDQLHDIRDALNQELVLGRDDFKDKIEMMTQRQTRRGKDGRPKIEDSAGTYYVI